MLSPSAILETILYGRDVPSMVGFYRDALGLRLLADWNDFGAVFRLAPGAVLVIFNPDKSSAAGRDVPSHGCTGPGHVALSIEDAAYDEWVLQLQSAGVEIEQEQPWVAHDGWRPGRSIYVRDPAGNSVELITADIWPE